MSRVEMIRASLEDSFRGSPFHSFLGSLKGVSEEDARWIPPRYHGFPHMDGSILNLAFHTGGDKHVLVSQAFGDASVTWTVVQGRFADLGGNLTAAKSLAQEGHALVLNALEAIGEARLDSARPYYGESHYRRQRSLPSSPNTISIMPDRYSMFGTCWEGERPH